jgi:hypothetical protein
MNEAVDTVLESPFDLPIRHLWVFFIIVAHKRRSVGVFIGEIVKASVYSRRTLFPRGIVMRRYDPVRRSRSGSGDIIVQFYVIKG